jgi:Fe-S oxidoreductase
MVTALPTKSSRWSKNGPIKGGRKMFDLSKCDSCGDCLVRCQYVDYDRSKAVREIKALIAGQDAGILTECVTCMACNEYCTKGANPYDLILQLQEEKGTMPLTEEQVKRFTAQESFPDRVIEGDPDKPALSLCTMKTRLPEGAVQGRMFDGLTIADGGKYYCYIMHLHLAREGYFKKNIQKYIDSLASLNKPEVVLIHDDCYSTATTKAREYGIKVPFRPVHIIEYLLNYLKAHPRSITRLDKRIAYQRPCISRYTPEKEPMLDELFELIGVERVARKYDRQDALCCGGVFIDKDRERGLRIQDRNITDALGYGADAMVMLCPICWMRLSQPCRERGLPPVYLSNLCRMALGELPFPSGVA